MKIYKKTTIDYNVLPFIVLWTFNIFLPNFVYANKYEKSINSNLKFNNQSSKSSLSRKKNTILPTDKTDDVIEVKKNAKASISGISKVTNQIQNKSDITLPSNTQRQTQTIKTSPQNKQGESMLNSTVVFDNENADSGPSSPEFSSFESVSTDKMVDPFTGDFTYNLPVLDVPGAHDGGYPISLSYHSGASPDAEASWVGYGFTLSPGAINRNKRGFPDDLKGENVEYVNNVPPNVTASVTKTAGAEVFSLDLSVSKTFTYNNYKGIRKSTSIGVGGEYGSLNFTFDNGKHSFSPSINILNILNKKSDDDSKKKKAIPKFNEIFNKKTQVKFSNKEMLNKKISGGSQQLGNSVFGVHAIGNDQSSPSSVSKYKGFSVNYSMGINTDPAFVVLGVDASLGCNFTRVKNEPNNKKAFGYMYSDDAYIANPEEFIMDYHTEKEAPASYRDNYIPITVADNDLFTVSTEGISGSFRAYWKTGGLFIPSTTESKIEHRTIPSPEVHFTTNIGLGIGMSAGESITTMSGNWKNDFGVDNNNYTDSLRFNKFNNPENLFFRFNADLAGNIDYGNSIDAVNVNIFPNSIPDTGAVTRIITSDNFLNSKRVGKSSQIVYFTNDQINKRNTIEIGSSTLPKLLYDYPYIDVNNTYINRSNLTIKDHIGEFVITNGTGSTYVYALPVYSRTEKSMSYNVPYERRKSVNGSEPGDYHIYAEIDPSLPNTGEIHDYSYANSFLLTSIRSSNYKDLDNDGKLNEADLGGYTKFEYVRTFGDKNKNAVSPWFQWRAPYSGLMLNQGQIHDRTDDMGSFSSGQKEVYYLDKIETKTHIAYFITNKTQANGIIPGGSQVTRHDAKGANSDDFLAAKQDVNGSQESRYLEKIILYSKYKEGGTNKLKKLKTVNFRYAHNTSVPWTGVWPNSFGADANKGKLTLSKIWVDDEEIVNAKVTPYEFKYEYPTNANYPTKYVDIKNYYSKFSGSILGNDPEKPDYKSNGAINVDRWGSYQADGKFRRSILNPYVDQTPMNNFDPAAWELKQIKLPTGAEIHVQYEQKDYAFVQNRVATTMVNFKDAGSSDANNMYILNLENVGNTFAELSAYKDALQTHFTKNPYIYFKFLYKFKNGNGGLPLSTTSCNYEYIDGYVKIIPSNIKIVNNELQISVGNGNATTDPSFNFLNSIGTSLPRYLCYDYYITETGKQAGRCSADGKYEEVLGSMDGISVAKDVLNYCMANLEQAVTGDNYCMAIEPSQSYFRLPIMPNANYPGKKGGGLRVKRVLMYDEGVETNNSDLALYGTEYIYKLDDTLTSSGVAANEPSDGREENPIIDFIAKKDDQSLSQKVIGGLDKEQFEGPYGESFLPSPSVGYSRVIAKSIHEGKTDIGFTVNEFYTAKDYPFDCSFLIDGQYRKPFEFTKLQKNKSFPVNIPTGIVNIKNNKMWMSQGYRFLSFTRHGLMKSISSYQGTNSQPFSAKTNPSLYKKEYSYFEPWEQVPVVKDVINETPVLKSIGSEMEIYTERRYIGDVTNIAGANADAAVGFAGPLPIITLSAIPTYTRTVNRFSRISTTKIIYMPNIPKSVTETKEGVTTTTENMAFSEYDGSPVVTKVKDVFNDLALSGGAAQTREIWNYNQQAALNYNAFKSKSLNEFKVWPSSTATTSSGIVKNPSLNLYYFEFPISGNPSIEEMNLSAGDLLLFDNTTNDVYNSNSPKYLYVSGVNYFQNTGNNKWVRYYLEPYLSGANFGQFSFVKFTVVKSGKSNELSTSAGSIITFKKSDFVPTVVSQQILDDRNSFLGNLNGSSGLINGSGTYPLNANNANNKIMAGTQSCLTVNEKTFGCNAPPPSCEKKECCLLLGTAADEMNGATNTQDYYIFLADQFHSLSTPTYPSVPPLSSLSPIMIYNLTDIKDNCCDGGANCINCPPKSSNSPSPYYLNSFAINIDPLFPITTPFGHRFRTKPNPNSLIGGWGIFYEPDASTSILIPFLTCLNPNLLQPLENDLENDFEQTFLTQSVKFNIKDKSFRCLPYQEMADDFDNDGVIDKHTEAFNCNDCYNYNQSVACSCSTSNASNFYLKTFTNTATNETYLTVLDQYHNSSIGDLNNFPVLDNYLSSIASSNFTNNKLKVCQITPPNCSLCPPVPTVLPYIINYQKIGKAGGTFSLDPYNKYTVLYTPPNDEAIAISILDFCNNAVASGLITNVLANSAVVYKHKWTENNSPKYYDDILNAPASVNNNFFKNKKGFWNPSKTFVYKADRTVSNPNSSNKIYDKGTYSLDFGGWANPDVSSKWITASTIKSISPNGEPIEELDALGNSNSSSLEGDLILPNYVAQNAPLNSVWFESLEKLNIPVNGHAVSIAPLGHSGNKCLKLDIATWTSYYQQEIPYSPSYFNNEIILRFWASADPNFKEANANLTSYKYFEEIKGEFSVNTPSNNIGFTAKRIASSGVWSLYEAKVMLNLLPTTGTLNLQIWNEVKLNGASTFTLNELAFIDDIRIQPISSQVKSFVYDYSKRKIVAEFDDQLFGLYYLYNAEGKLVRKIKETERGLKMLEERQYNLKNKLPR
jgi:hypothetical protein